MLENRVYSLYLQARVHSHESLRGNLACCSMDLIGSASVCWATHRAVINSDLEVALALRAERYADGFLEVPFLFCFLSVSK